MATFRVRQAAKVLSTAMLSLSLLWSAAGDRQEARRPARGATSAWVEVRSAFRHLVGNFWELSGSSLDPNGQPQPGSSNPGSGGTTNSGSSLDPNG